MVLGTTVFGVCRSSGRLSGVGLKGEGWGCSSNRIFYVYRPLQLCGLQFRQLWHPKPTSQLLMYFGCLRPGLLDLLFSLGARN